MMSREREKRKQSPKTINPKLKMIFYKLRKFALAFDVDHDQKRVERQCRK